MNLNFFPPNPPLLTRQPPPPRSQARAGQHQRAVQPQRPGGAPAGRLAPHAGPHDGWAGRTGPGCRVVESEHCALHRALRTLPVINDTANQSPSHQPPFARPHPQAMCGCRLERSGATAWMWACASRMVARGCMSPTLRARSWRTETPRVRRWRVVESSGGGTQPGLGAGQQSMQGSLKFEQPLRVPWAALLHNPVTIAA